MVKHIYGLLQLVYLPHHDQIFQDDSSHAPEETPITKELGEILVREVFRLHGLHGLDRGPQFISRFWKEFCDLLGITVSLSSGYHSQTDGQTVRVNQEVETEFHLLCHQDLAKWSNGAHH